ncbi:hypothetical protein C4561_02160 [candidate division WWE3 bacterium]|jgi:hypothetical protein|uniref:Uncharacterized protein n=1 Tax=candidate division WWE3 bacterium TaxID=2053526 RepID=A0A3A4ZKR9_UNCKA|nr:MAG: hypothetical protein C4561_02160 [candidate division WWE3 bacterium]
MANKRKAHKKERRLNEAKKAQVKYAGRIVQHEDIHVAASAAVSSNSNSEQVLLPLSEIKRDLIKNLGFALFSIILLVLLKNTGFGADAFSQLFRL